MSKPQHIREGVIDAMVSALQEIGRDPSVEWAVYDAPSVYKANRSAFTRENYPFIQVIIQGEAISQRSTCGSQRIMDSTLSILLECWVETDNFSEDLSRILHDVEYVQGVDPSFGATCRDSIITGNATYIDEALEGRCAVFVNVEVQYGYLESNPSEIR